MRPFQPKGHVWLFGAVRNVASRYAGDAVGRCYATHGRLHQLREEEHASIISEAGRVEMEDILATSELAQVVLRRVEGRIQDALMQGDLVAIEHRQDGELVPVPAAWWRREGVENEFRNSRDYRSPFTGIVFLEAAALDRLFAPDMVAQTAVGEKRLVARLKMMMCAAPTTPRSKADVAAECKDQPGIEASGRGFTRAWNLAVKQSGATAWSAPGRKTKTKQSMR